jgi:hypothetical protein
MSRRESKKLSLVTLVNLLMDYLLLLGPIVLGLLVENSREGCCWVFFFKISPLVIGMTVASEHLHQNYW